MKAINGKLDQSKKYKLAEVIIGDYKCDNCNNPIKNIAVVIDNNNKKYYIGLDCMASLTSIAPSEIQEAKNKINRKIKIKREIKKLVKFKKKVFIICFTHNNKKMFRLYLNNYNLTTTDDIEKNNKWLYAGYYKSFKNIFNKPNVYITKII